MTTPQADRPTGLSWSLRSHYLGAGVQRYRAPGLPLSTLTTNALCDPQQRLYTVDELRTFSFADSVLDKDHPMCKRCLRKAEKEASRG